MRYVIGDIHGMYCKMLEALNNAGFDPDRDTLYGLGDFGDRGPDTLKVIEYLMKLKNFKSVFGNHDMWLYQFLRSDVQYMKRDDFNRDTSDQSLSFGFCEGSVISWPKDSLLSGIKRCWENNGGEKTIASFNGVSDKRRKEILSWLESLVYRIELDDYIIQHTFPNSYRKFFPDGNYSITMKDLIDKDICRKDYDEDLWSRTLIKCSKVINGERAYDIKEEGMEENISQKTMVIGHSPTQGFNLPPVPVYDRELNFILIDTGSFVTKDYGFKEDGAITVYNMDTRDWFTSNGKHGVIELN